MSLFFGGGDSHGSVFQSRVVDPQLHGGRGSPAVSTTDITDHTENFLSNHNPRLLPDVTLTFLTSVSFICSVAL